MDQLVVALHRCDRIAEFLPYVAAMARPGMSISFLVHYASAEFQEVMDGLTLSPPVSDYGRALGRASLVAAPDHQAKVDNHVAALRQAGVKLKVSVYSGSTGKALRQFATEQPAGLLIMRGGTRCALTRALRRARWLARLFNRRAAGSSVVLVRSLLQEGRLGSG